MYLTLNKKMEKKPLYYGARDKAFQEFLIKIIKYTGIEEPLIKKYVNDETLPYFNRAFTSKSADEVNNYENFEQMGDATIGKFIVWNSYEKFPQIRENPSAVEIVARMKINLGSKDNLSTIAENLGLWPYITATEDERFRSKKKLLEDVFEALIGVIEYIFYDYSDPNYSQPGLAYQLVYSILSKLFEPYILKIDYSLVDPKNRLKGVFDQYKEILGSEAIYKSTSFKTIDPNNKVIYIFKTKVYDNKNNFLGEGTASNKKDSEKKAAEVAILTLEKKGYKKTVPSFYSNF